MDLDLLDSKYGIAKVAYWSLLLDKCDVTTMMSINWMECMDARAHGTSLNCQPKPSGQVGCATRYCSCAHVSQVMNFTKDTFRQRDLDAASTMRVEAQLSLWSRRPRRLWRSMRKRRRWAPLVPRLFCSHYGYVGDPGRRGTRANIVKTSSY